MSGDLRSAFPRSSADQSTAWSGSVVILCDLARNSLPIFSKVLAPGSAPPACSGRRTRLTRHNARTPVGSSGGRRAPRSCVALLGAERIRSGQGFKVGFQSNVLQEVRNAG